MDRWKSRGRKSQRGEEQKREDQRKSKCEKVEKSRFTVLFQWFVDAEGRKVGSQKSGCGAIWPNCTPFWPEAHLQVKKLKTPHDQSTFGSWDIEKVHAVVARSTFPSQHVQTPQLRSAFRSCDVEKVHAVVTRSTLGSQNVQSIPCLDHFWKLTCRKSARRSGAKHISKSKCTKHNRFGALLEVDMSKKCTPLWREAHFEVKSVKNWRVRSTFDVVLRGRRRGFCMLSKVSKTWRFCCNFNFNHHYTTLHSTTLHYPTLPYITLHYTTLHYITPHYTTLHYITPHYTTLHYITLHYTTLRYITPHYTTLHHITLQP